MRHEIPVQRLGPQAQSMADAVGSCVHCGFRLPTCPTYVTMGEEMDSPRGRIFLMKEVLEGQLELETALPYIDNCLGCQACETACPSGVQYGELITPFRAYAEQHREREPLDRAQRAMVLRTLPHPRRFRLAARLGRVAKPLAGRLPASMGAMLRLLPDRLPPAQRLPTVVPAQGERRARVALLAGCAQQVLAPDINLATLRVLARNGVETVIPPAQGCCGALAMHTGAAERAKGHARRNLLAFPDDVDAVITNAAGCGSGMKEYGLLFAGEPEHEAAQRLADRTVDVSIFLSALGLCEPPPPLAAPLTVAYHDACHLAHAQGVRREPRDLLRAIDGVTLAEPAEWELCCGSAGTYNVEKPETADALGRRKATNLLATDATLIASGNIGCLTQVQTHLRALGHELPVLHTLQVLDRAYTRTLIPGSTVP
jgi:glycolate oxidase iron-sulfur subunit